jgi:SAM-dependent methyltransferase
MSNICRICKKNLSSKILTLENIPLTDEFINKEDSIKKEYLKNVDIYNCDNCGIIQNPNNFDYELYYKNYEYSSGHSSFTKNFMVRFADVILKSFKQLNGKSAESILEIGSGNGQQLLQFKLLGAKYLYGIEPSEYLAQISNNFGISTIVEMFGSKIIEKISRTFDICLSSYTFDHMRDPIDYLKAAHRLLNQEGILALEVHDFEKINERTEFCLFEHEHTIYMSSSDICFLLEKSGFSILSVNPIDSVNARANSLIVVAKKNNDTNYNFTRKMERTNIFSLQDRIISTISKIEKWINSLPKSAQLVGYGAGGRGIITIATLSNYKRIQALFDSNYHSEKYLTPKTRIPIVGKDKWHEYNNAYCIVFSFGYFNEISKDLFMKGFQKSKIISLLDFYTNKI